jgi:hypothetical protein
MSLAIIWFEIHGDEMRGVLVLPALLLVLILLYVLLVGLTVLVGRGWYKMCCELAGEPDAYSMRDPLPPKNRGHW